MKVVYIVLATGALVQGGLAPCGWKLKPNDCICMNSVDGSLMDDETATCCRNMGLRTQDNVRSRQVRHGTV
jgi:hypothetical protein